MNPRERVALTISVTPETLQDPQAFAALITEQLRTALLLGAGGVFVRVIGGGALVEDGAPDVDDGHCPECASYIAEGAPHAWECPRGWPAGAGRQTLCPLEFKSPAPGCGYRGDESECNKTFRRCVELDNVVNFRGGLQPMEGVLPPPPVVYRCCVCDRPDPEPRAMVMLDFEAPAGFFGWGCVVCNLPARGATAFVCERCADTGWTEAQLRYIAAGHYVLEGIRVSLDGYARIPFQHDPSQHPELQTDG
jgi:hypothetical protein